MTSSGGSTVYECFERIARVNPNRDAIRDHSRVLTYGALEELSNRIAGHLIEHDVRHGDRVALLFHRDPSECAALLAVLKIGAVAVPLVSANPPERLRQIIADSDPRVMLTHGASAPGPDLLGLRLPILEVDRPSALPIHRDVVPPVADSPAIITYTSGSTGRPKGVLLNHAFVLEKFERLRAAVGPKPGDRLTMFSNYALGQGQQMIMAALLSGATLCPFDVRRDGLARLTAWLSQNRITVYLSSATLFRSLVRTLDAGRQFPDVRVVIATGERVIPDDVGAHGRHFPGARLVVHYSSTETGLIALHQVERGQTFADGVVPVGSPPHGVVVRILDDASREVRKGQPGEIVVESARMASEYWRDPERTARTFEPLDGAIGVRRCRTGDIGRVREDGLLEHLGRKDLRVKIRGFRIEIEEVETALNREPDILRAAVTVRPDRDEDLRLVAYVQLVPGADATVEGVRARLALHLPDHMIPSTFVILDDMPLTDSGKIARQLLPEPTAERPRLGAGLVPPRNDLESAVAEVWREVLGLDRVGVHDPFLAVGGDSLKATLVASRLASRVGVELPLSLLFEAPTVAEIAAVLARLVPDRGADDEAGLGDLI